MIDFRVYRCYNKTWMISILSVTLHWTVAQKSIHLDSFDFPFGFHTTVFSCYWKLLLLRQFPILFLFVFQPGYFSKGIYQAWIQLLLFFLPILSCLPFYLGSSKFPVAFQILLFFYWLNLLLLLILMPRNAFHWSSLKLVCRFFI